MTLLQAILLGIIQGLTEFIPVSSSAHLVLTPFLLGWNLPPAETFVFDVLVQVASLAAVIAYFWSDLLAIGNTFIRGLITRRPFAETEARLGWLLILATIPAGLAGVLLQDQFKAAFSNPLLTAFNLWVTAGLLVIAERFGRRSRKMDNLNWLDALWIGLAQAISILPGISRSGATITGGMTRHLERSTATRFAFLMSVPVMTAAGLFSLIDLTTIPNFIHLLPSYLPGFLASAVVSYISIRWLLSYLARHSLYVFAGYCFIFGAITMGSIYLGL